MTDLACHMRAYKDKDMKGIELTITVAEPEFEHRTHGFK